MPKRVPISVKGSQTLGNNRIKGSPCNIWLLEEVWARGLPNSEEKIARIQDTPMALLPSVSLSPLKEWTVRATEKASRVVDTTTQHGHQGKSPGLGGRERQADQR